jgi:hypothetical protein
LGGEDMIGEVESAVLIIVVDLFIFDVLGLSFRVVLSFGGVVFLRLAFF